MDVSDAFDEISNWEEQLLIEGEELGMEKGRELGVEEGRELGYVAFALRACTAHWLAVLWCSCADWHQTDTLVAHGRINCACLQLQDHERRGDRQ